MPIKIGTVEVGSILRGSTVINKIYRGTTVIYELADGTYLELIEDITVSGSAVTSVVFDNFTATKEDTLLLVSDIVNPTGSISNYLLIANGINATYYRQRLTADSTSVSGARNNDSLMMNGQNGENSLAITDIKLTNDGYFTYQSHTTTEYTATDLRLYDNYVASTFTISSITELEVRSSVANAIGVGSRFSLYKVRLP